MRVPTWLLWAAAALVMVAALAVQSVLGQPEGESSSAPSAATGSPSSSGAQGEARHEDAPFVAPARGSWRMVAAEHLRAFGDTTGGRSAWLERLSQTSAPGLLAGYELSDFRVVSATRLVRLWLVEDLRTDVLARVIARGRYASGLVVELVIEPVSGTWRVSGMQPIERAQQYEGSEA